MNLYRCYLYGAVGTKPVCMSIQGDSDSQARRTAMQVLHDRPDVERVEAWRDADIAFRVNRHNMIAEGEADGRPPTLGHH